MAKNLDKRDIPNFLSVIRLLCVPIFVLLMLDPLEEYAGIRLLYFALAVFLFASFTDYLDGVLARKFKAVSDTGKLLDPLADKILVMSALIMLVAQRSDETGNPWIPGWLVVLLLARETWVTGLRGLAATRGVVIAAGMAGKIKSLLQMTGVSLVLLYDYPIFIGQGKVTAAMVGVNLLVLSVVFSLWGAIDYTAAVFSAEEPADKELSE